MWCRRFGKTTSVAMFLAAYALCVSGSESCVFSTGKRASSKMLELIAQLVEASGNADLIAKQNQVRAARRAQPRGLPGSDTRLTYVPRRSNCGSGWAPTCARSAATRRLCTPCAVLEETCLS